MADWVRNEMKREDLRSQALDLLRFPLAVVIVVNHIFNMMDFSVQGEPVSVGNIPLMADVNNVLNAFGRYQSVPIYFFISGYVFFLTAEFTERVYVRKLKNRVKSLLIPYVLWNLFSLLIFFVMFLPCFSSIFPNLHNLPLDFSLSAILNTFWDASRGIIYAPVSENNYAIYPQNNPLWFVRDLMIVVLTTPIIYLLIRRAGKWFVLFLGLMWFVLSYKDFGHLSQLLSAYFFFSWGSYMSIERKDMIREFGRVFKVSMLIYPLMSLSLLWVARYLPEAYSTLKSLNIIAGLFFAYNLSAWLLTHRICKVSPFLASSGFFIYLAHSLVCSYLVRILFLLLRPSDGWSVLFVYLLSAAITITALLLIFYLMRRYTPALLKVIAGRK